MTYYLQRIHRISRHFSNIKMSTESLEYFVEKSFQLECGTKISAKVWGESNLGESVMALHGWMDNAATFDLVAPKLSSPEFNNCKIVAIDFPGHGKSSHLSIDANYQHTDYIYYTMEVAKILGWDKSGFTILGHSMGAGVALSIASAFPEQINQCIIIELLGVLSSKVNQTSANIRKFVEQKKSFMTRKLLPPKVVDYGTAIDMRVANVSKFPGNQTLSRSAAERLIARGTVKVNNDPNTSQVQFTHDVKLLAASGMYFSEEMVISVLYGVQCPITLFLGESGFPLNEEKHLAREFILGDLIRTYRIPGSHHLHLEEEYYEAMLSILKDEKILQPK